jgi:hypothetical protein
MHDEYDHHHRSFYPPSEEQGMSWVQKLGYWTLFVLNIVLIGGLGFWLLRW